jgi:eight-cysteine-cluster-containing protein
MTTGCSGQLCMSADGDPIFTTCEWREEYACYQNAMCEKQADGDCGWTPTDELAECLDNAGSAAQ